MIESESKLVECIGCDRKIQVGLNKGTLRLTCPSCRSQWEVFTGHSITQPMPRALANANLRDGKTQPSEPRQQSWFKAHSSILFYSFFLFGVPLALMLAYIDPILMWIAYGIYTLIFGGAWFVGIIDSFSGRGSNIEGRGPDLGDGGG